jgi:hypothetical protein
MIDAVFDSDKVTVNAVLRDGAEGSTKTQNVTVEVTPLGIDIKAQGYGNLTMEDGYGTPVFLEFYEGSLRLLYFPDINQEEPVVVPLEGALESNRKETT